MSGLPEGWEADYDGRRWFYKYKPTGHIQYHFPKEGDEFPDFIDSFSPAPDLAPEERLESQQQVRRHGSTTAAPARLSPKKDDGGYGMSATARPVSMTWDGAFEEESTVFQPENFMYLGPGTYTDVSPLAEEEEEAARRVVAGGIEGRVDKSPSKGVSPLNSERTTPSQSTANAGPIAGEPVLVPPTVVEEIHEMPSHEPPPAPDPVGIIAEMPTYDTAQAHIEKHPPPIEMADNTVLAPIETAVPVAELPERTSPIEKKKDEPQLAPGSLRNYSIPMRPLKIDKNPLEDAPPMVQPYKPETRIEIPPNPAPLRRSTFQPGEPMANSSPIRPPDRGHAGTPNVLSPPQVPPKRPLDEPSQPQIPFKPAFDQSSRANLPPVAAKNAPYIPGQEPELSHMPSVLKPARGKGPGQPEPGPTRPPQGHVYVPPTQGKHPPSMTPAPMVQQQRLEEPRMGVQRINTVPDSLPSQRPQSVIQNGHQGLPLSTANRPHMPKRPASVMPDMMGTQTQAQYRSPIEGVPPKNLPRSATAGPGTQFPPYPVDNLPYPDDRPAFRREDPPYPEEPFVQKTSIPDRGPVNPSPPPHNNRRHSSYSSAIVSPDSRHGSMSFPTQTPSPMEHSRRASTTSSSIPNYTPSPVSNTPPSTQGLSLTPPPATGNQYPQGSYFNVQDAEGQSYNPAARDVLRRQSLSRGVDPRRNSVGTDPVTVQRGSPLAQQTVQGYNTVPQGLPHSQSVPQVSQVNTALQSQRPVAPTPPPQGQQGLGRIEEYEEVPIGTISRSSTASITSETRKGSFSSSAQPSPMGSRRASWQAEGPRNVPPGQFQGQQIQAPQSNMGQPVPQGQVSQAAPMPPQNLQQLQRKPSQGNAHHLQGQQVPMHDPRVPRGMPQHQGVVPHGQLVQGQMFPPHAQSRAPQPGQINTQVQNALQGPVPPVLPPKPVPMRLQKRSTYGPSSPVGQTVPQGPLPPSLKGENQIQQQGPITSQMPPPGQPTLLQKAHPSRVQPHVQIPQDQGSWQPNPHPVMPQNTRPVSMQPQSTQSAGSKEGKEGKKWLKWLKGGSKSVSHSPTTPVISSPISPVIGRPGWGGGEYSQQAVWQPGQAISTGPQPGLQGNMPPPQSVQMQMQTQMPPQPVQIAPQQAPVQSRPVQRQSHSFQTVHESDKMGFQAGQPGQMPIHSRQIPPQAEHLPPQRKYSPPQQVQTPIRQEQMAPPQNQMPSQPRQLSFQKRLSLQQTPTPAQSNDMAMAPSQGPPPGPAPMHSQPEPRAYRVTAQSTAGPPVEKPANSPANFSRSVKEAPVGSQPDSVARQQVIPPCQPSPGEVRPLEQAPVPRSKTPETTQPLQTSASHYLQPDSTVNESLSPHAPAASPGHSDTANTPLSRMSSQKSYFSDAGSITTIEVAQAQPQAVLKPSIVQVKRKSTGMWRQSQEIQQHNASQSSSDVTPRISAETPRAGTEPALPPSSLQHQQTVAQPGPAHEMDTLKYDNTTAPLFHDSSAPKTAQIDTRDEHKNKEPAAPSKSEQPSAADTNNDIAPLEQNNHVVGVKTNEVQYAPTKPAPLVEDKWAKKPVVDYSGGDWGDDDDWDY
ncbi:hypothetical protein FPOAC2_08876 [Fusarium poae]|uniref:WW domain-containing protein n=1 Tax=Fusarium poae TaxID=36050 RepID=A0A1B8AMK4_FUSPO|nr:hypothetical protein FPOAC1_008938 [Fusarium poae]KAG8669543.1 hypothetical protein FPOAC1_008938 [Fusarium poae]OBS21765.1 hypothetical protein FPOA_08102 [Fusarium poae]